MYIALPLRSRGLTDLHSHNSYETQQTLKHSSISMRKNMTIVHPLLELFDYMMTPSLKPYNHENAASLASICTAARFKFDGPQV